jgi:hypothetical protein
MNTINKEKERHEIEALLPWHAAGTLSRRDAIAAAPLWLGSASKRCGLDRRRPQAIGP